MLAAPRVRPVHPASRLAAIRMIQYLIAPYSREQARRDRDDPIFDRYFVRDLTKTDVLRDLGPDLQPFGLDLRQELVDPARLDDPGAEMLRRFGAAGDPEAQAVDR